MTGTDGIVQFIEARTAELEADALESENAPEGALRFLDADKWTEALSWQADADLVLRRVTALRAILAEHTDSGGWCHECTHQIFPCTVLRHLGSVDAGHPDYDPSWSPLTASTAGES